MPIVQIRGVQEVVRDLRRMREKAVPYAMRNALNTSAFEARAIWQAEIRSSFTNRNQYTARSVLVERASIGNMVARVGSTAAYMGKQETGGTVTGGSGRKPIPAPTAAGLPAGSKRTKLVQGRYYLGKLQVAHPALRGNRKQRNAIRIAVAQRAGQRVVLLERPHGGKGLFLIAGRKRSPVMRLLWDVSHASVHVPAMPTLERTLAAIQPKLEHIHLAALFEQLRRAGIPYG